MHGGGGGGSSGSGSQGPPEKRQMMSNSSLGHGVGISNAALGGNHAGQGLSGNHQGSINVMGQIRASGGSGSVGVSGSSSSSGQNVNLHYGTTSSHHGQSLGGGGHSSGVAGQGQNLALQSNASTLGHSAGNPVIVTTTLGTGANAINLGSTSYTAESEVMRAASQAIAMTHQMQQGRRTASLKASVEAATSGGGVGGSGPVKDLLGRDLVGATHNAIQAVERESFNSNQRRHKKCVESTGGGCECESLGLMLRLSVAGNNRRRWLRWAPWAVRRPRRCR